jgi:hypothetical protein
MRHVLPIPSPWSAVRSFLAFVLLVMGVRFAMSP